MPRADYTERPKDLVLLGAAMKALRLGRDLKQIEVATAAGMTESQISAIENGKNDPGWKLVMRMLTKGLGLELRDLATAYEQVEGKPPDAPED